MDGSSSADFVDAEIRSKLHYTAMLALSNFFVEKIDKNAVFFQYYAIYTVKWARTWWFHYFPFNTQRENFKELHFEQIKDYNLTLSECTDLYAENKIKYINVQWTYVCFYMHTFYTKYSLFWKWLNKIFVTVLCLRNISAWCQEMRCCMLPSPHLFEKSLPLNELTLVLKHQPTLDKLQLLSDNDSDKLSAEATSVQEV